MINDAVCSISSLCEIWGGIWVNLASSALEIGIISVAAWMVYISKTRRKKRFFFGKMDKLTIYTSNILVTSSNDFRGISRSYQDSSIPSYELSIITEISTSLKLNSSISGDESFVSKILKTFSTPTVDVKVSPNSVFDENSIPDSCIISIGSPGYNCVSEFIENASNLGKFTANNAGVALDAISATNESFLVQRTRLKYGGWAFYIAGTSARASEFAAKELTKNWKSLDSEFGSNEFCKIFKIDNNAAKLIHTKAR